MEVKPRFLLPQLDTITITLSAEDAASLVYWPNGGTSKELRRQLVPILEKAGNVIGAEVIGNLWPNGRVMEAPYK